MTTKRIRSAEENIGRGSYDNALDDLLRDWAHGSVMRDEELLVVHQRLVVEIRDGASGPTKEKAERFLDDINNQLQVVRGQTDQGPRWRTGIPVATAPTLPGFEIVEYVGEVFGVVVRSRGAFPAIGAQLKSVGGGEIRTMTNLLTDSRREAVDRMVQEAEERQADAVISMRFDANAMADRWTEVCAYGTAVRIRPRPSD